MNTLTDSRFHLTSQRLIILCLLGLLTFATLITIGGIDEIGVALTNVDWRLLLIAITIHYSGFIVRGYRWQTLLHTQGYILAYGYLTSLLFAGWFVSAVLPARAGDAVRIGVLRMARPGQPSVPVAAGLGSIVLERALDMLAILVWGASFAFFTLRNYLPVWVMTIYAVGIAALLLLTGLLLATPLLIDTFRRISSHVRWHQLLDFIQQTVTSIHGLRRHPGAALGAGLASLYIWLTDAFLLWLIVGSLGQWTSLASMGFVALTVDATAAFPLTPGGIGQIESTYGALLALLPLPSINIPIVILVTRFVSYWSFLLVSGVITFTAGFGAFLRGVTPSTRSE